MAQYRSKTTGLILNSESAPFGMGEAYFTNNPDLWEAVTVSEPQAIATNTQANALFGGAGSTPQQTSSAIENLRVTNPTSYDQFAFGTQQISGRNINELKGLGPNDMTEGEAYQVAYSRNPDLFKQIESLSKRENKPMASYQNMMPDSNTAGYFARAFESRPDYVNPVDPYSADQETWLKQNAGPVAAGVAALTGVGAPLSGALAGFGTASAIGGIQTGIETLPWSLGGAYGADYLASKGVFGNTLANNQLQASTGAVTGAGQNTQATQNIFGGGQTVASETGTGTAFGNLGLSSGTGLKISDPEIAKLVGDTSGMTGGQVLNKVIGSDPSLLQKISSAFSTGGVMSGINEIMQNKTTASIFTSLLSSFLGGAGDKPEQSTVETGGVNVLQSFVDRLNPDYYGMTQDDKDAIFDANIGKIQAALARKGLTKGASEVEATSKLIQAIELEDLQNKQSYANQAWGNFINFLNGNEAVARANYQADLAEYEAKKQTLNDRIADIVDIISPEKSLSQILQSYYA